MGKHCHFCELEDKGASQVNHKENIFYSYVKPRGKPIPAIADSLSTGK